MLFDTHAHLNFTAYKQDVDKVIHRSLDNDVWLINIGTNYYTSQKAREIAQRYKKGVFAAVGLHPLNLDTGLVKIKKDLAETENHQFEREFDYQRYKKLAQEKKVIAIGEIGLDYYWKPKTKRKSIIFKEKQKELFLKQLELAKELNLPVIFHCRMAHQDLLEILAQETKSKKGKIKGVMHSFVGTLEEFQKYLDLEFYIGFNGIIFKEIEGINFEEIIKRTPLDKILIETDCPYLTPPQAGEKRNEPLFVKYIAQEIAKIKEIDFEEIAEITSQNAKSLFNI